MDHWLNRGTNKEYVQRLRSLISEKETQVFIFLGAGLSFAVDRGRIMFEHSERDDSRRFPSWSQLINRMKEQLLTDPVLKPYENSVNRFFDKEGALDCAELFRNYTRGPNYWDFLKRQFESQPDDNNHLTRSHSKLTLLPIKHIFTTNYDELIETAYHIAGKQICVSSSSRDFMDHRAMKNIIHLIKLHGTIAHPDTIVLTRSDYAKSRHERSEMFRFLVDQFEYATFLFVGFSLLDPNFNILFDEAHYARDDKNPVSYIVQAQEDPIRDSYLRSLGVNPITLNHWDQLPSFLSAIHPNTDLASLTAY